MSHGQSTAALRLARRGRTHHGHGCLRRPKSMSSPDRSIGDTKAATPWKKSSAPARPLALKFLNGRTLFCKSLLPDGAPFIGNVYIGDTAWWSWRCPVSVVIGGAVKQAGKALSPGGLRQGQKATCGKRSRKPVVLAEVNDYRENDFVRSFPHLGLETSKHRRNDSMVPLIRTTDSSITAALSHVNVWREVPPTAPCGRWRVWCSRCNTHA